MTLLVLHIPAWFPMATWKRIGLDVRARFAKMQAEPYEYVKSMLVS